MAQLKLSSYISSLSPIKHMHLGKPIWGHSDKVAIHKPRNKLSPETDCVNIVI